MNIKNFKINAKKSLKGKYKESIKLLLVFILVAFLSSFLTTLIMAILASNGVEFVTISYLKNIIILFIEGILYFGQFSFFLKISRNEEVTYKEIFSKTSYGLPFIIITLLVCIFTFLWSLLFIIPGIIAAISYSMVSFVALDNPELKPMEALRKSQELINGYKTNYFILELSFIGWIILGIFTLGILYLWLVPYMQVTRANFYNELKKRA